jgi:hypothetical protein
MAQNSIAIDAEVLAGKRFGYQEDISLVDDLDLMDLTPGRDLNWLEDIHLLEEDGTPAVFDRNSNSFLKIYFAIPEGREDEIARKVLMKHLISGNSYGIQLKEKHCKFHQVELGPWVADSKSVGDDYTPPCSRAGSHRFTRPDSQPVLPHRRPGVGGVPHVCMNRSPTRTTGSR